MKSSALAVAILALSFPLHAQDLNSEVTKLILCVDIVNQHVQRVEIGAARPDHRLTQYMTTDGREYHIDDGLVLKRSGEGLKLQFSMGPTDAVRVDIDGSSRTFTIYDRNHNTITGKYTVQANGRVALVSVGKASSGFAVGDIAAASSRLIRMGIVVGQFIIAY